MLLTIKTPYTCMEFQVTSMQARQLIDEAYQMAVSTLNEEDSNNPLFCPPFDLPDVSEFDEAPDNSEFVIGPAASKNIENGASHSRYFSDELDAQDFWQKEEQMFDILLCI